MEEIQAENLKLKAELARVKCYLGNAEEYIDKIDPLFVDLDNDGKVDKLSFANWIKLLQTTWDQIKKSQLECQGRTLEVKLPDGWLGNAVNAVLGLIGIRL